MVTHKAEKNCKVPVLLVLGLLFGISNLFAQTAMVTNNYVYYPDSADKNYQCRTLPKDINMLYDRSFYTTATAGNTNVQSVDPWVNSALIEFDKVFPDENTSNPPYPNHCLTLCSEVTCSNPVRKVESSDSDSISGGNGNVINLVASGDFPIQTILFDIFKYQANINPYSPDSAPPIRTIAMYPSPNTPDIDNICRGVPIYGCSDDGTGCESCCDDCSWSESCVSNSVSPSQVCHNLNNKYDCNAEAPFCNYIHQCTYVDHSCQNDGELNCNSTYCYVTPDRECLPKPNVDDICSSDLESCYNSYGHCTPLVVDEHLYHECLPPEEDPCMDIDPHDCSPGTALYEGHICAYDPVTYRCIASDEIAHCGDLGECDMMLCQSDYSICETNTSASCSSFGQQSNCNAHSTFCEWKFTGVSCSHPSECNETVMARFSNKDNCNAGITVLNFCTAWDGSYEIDGEFGKTNGQFGYRTTIKTNYPGDGISVASDLSIEHMIVYPGDTQIPIQVDVTNVHSVRSSPTLVGKSPAVITQPYRIRYRLSKDATTVINIMDPTTSSVVRHLVQGQPRDGEGFQGGVTSGSSPDIQITNEDAWDGRDDEGRLLPYGNYLVSIQATSQDEWSGTTKADISRAVTRQLSLDPLKITDIVASGLGKQSTSYAMLSYMLTEAATVHFEVYTPGTTFEDLNICEKGKKACNNVLYPSSGPVLLNNTTVKNGKRVAKYSEQKEGRKSVNSKWDGMCWDEGEEPDISACGKTSDSSTTSTGYAYGGAMPDGDYVYLLWAEIPYQDSSYAQYNTASTTQVNGVYWDGVKTYMIYNGILPINRGYPEITIDAVSYSTIGSSPIANGLDPFVVSYSLSRDSYVDAGIYTTAASGTVTAGICEAEPGTGTPTKCAPYLVKTISENEVKEALTKNTYYWDGLDDLGRYVSAGNYMLRITAKDALFPAKVVTRTIEFPVDMFRVVDVETTPLLETSSGALNGLASISYMLSKSMGSEVKIYDKGVVIPKGGYDGNGNACPWPPLEQTGSLTPVECLIHYSTDTSSPVSPIKVFRGTEQGEGYTITDFWDGYKTYDATGATDEAIMVKDGLYPYIIIASAPVAGSQYYDTSSGVPVPLNGKWHELNYMLASDKVTGYITVSRGPVYFTNIKINPTKPTQYYSSATVELAPYEIQFAVNRGSSVTVEVISMEDYTCNNEPAPSVCRTLTQTNYTNGNLETYMVYDANVINTLYWDGKDNNGKYVKTANYQIKFSAQPYLTGRDSTIPEEINDGNGSTIGIIKTVESRSLSVNNFQVFDRYIWDVSKQNSEQGKFAFQVSVPMKTAIQIYKPGTVIAPEKDSFGNYYYGLSSGTLLNPIYSTYSPLPAEAIVYSTDTSAVLVKAIVGIRPNLVSLEEIWDGTDYAGQKVPDGIYPYRYVTVLDSYRMNSVTGDPILEEGNKEYDEVPEVVADWDKFINLGLINVANGDSWYADLDWKNDRVTSFYPNPVVNNPREGFFEITKVPAPGTVSIKIYNIAGDLVKDSGYECVNALGTTASLENINASGGISPDWNGYGTHYSVSGVGKDPDLLNSKSAGRNFALRCRWKTDNNAGKSVARGLYYAIMTLEPNRGNAKKSQKVVKILIP